MSNSDTNTNSLRAWAHRREAWLVLLSIGALLVVAGVWTGRGVRVAAERAGLAADGAPKFTPTPALSDDYNDYALWEERIRTSVSAWTVADAERLLDAASRGPTDEHAVRASTPGATIADQEPHFWLISASVIGDRLGSGQPIESAARERLIEGLFEMLSSPHESIRRAGASAIFSSRLLRDPAIRARYMSMREQIASVVDVDVALEVFDEQERIRSVTEERRRTHPGGSR